MLQRDMAQPRLLQRESEIFHSEERERQEWIYLYTPELDPSNEDRARELLWSALQEL